MIIFSLRTDLSLHQLHVKAGIKNGRDQWIIEGTRSQLFHRQGTWTLKNADVSLELVSQEDTRQPETGTWQENSSLQQITVTVECHDTHFPTVEPTEEPTEEPTRRPTLDPTELCTSLLVTGVEAIDGADILQGIYSW